MQMIVFTDLDGTLLDPVDYSFEPALPAIEKLRGLKIPLVFCSSKTMMEIEVIRTALSNTHPFIVENGGAIYVPKDYFDFTFPHTMTRDDYYVLELGTGYEKLRAVLNIIQAARGLRLRGFGDMSAEEVSRLTGLSVHDAALAKMREYDEPFVIESGNEDDVINAIRQRGYQVARSRFLHITGRSDKGRAVTVLKGLFRRRYSEIRTIAIGDSPNDIPMLEQVDIPIVVKRADGTYDPKIAVHRLCMADGIGPAGWNRADRKSVV